MYRFYPKEKALEIYTFIIEEENRNIEGCLKNFSIEEKELVNKLVKRMRENIEDDWEKIKSF
jgi:hypothetical protein